MCGIIGYVGRRTAMTRLLGGLERLEYRGYDSAGICVLGPDGLELTRAVGKLDELRRKIDGDGGDASTGIGHTRWATHGPVTEANAHPLPAGAHRDVAIVLNGIVENHAQLRRELIAAGGQGGVGGQAAREEAEQGVAVPRRLSPARPPNVV